MSAVKNKTVRFQTQDSSNSNDEDLLELTYNVSPNLPDEKLVIDIFGSMFQKTLKNNLLESINNFDKNNVYTDKKEYMGENVINNISIKNGNELIQKMKEILQYSQYYNKEISKHLQDTEIWDQIFDNIVQMKKNTFLDYVIKAFSKIRDIENGYDYSVVVLLKLFYPSFSYFCKDLDRSEASIIYYFKHLVKYKFFKNKNNFIFLMARHLRLAYGCNFGSSIEFRQDGGSLGEDKEYTKYNGYRYRVYIGVKGGKYILVKNKKIYLSK
jgi:hypothetical protein